MGEPSSTNRRVMVILTARAAFDIEEAEIAVKAMIERGWDVTTESVPRFFSDPDPSSQGVPVANSREKETKVDGGTEMH